MSKAEILIGREQDKKDPKIYLNHCSLVIDNEVAFIQSPMSYASAYKIKCEQASEDCADTLIEERIIIMFLYFIISASNPNF